MSKRKIYEALAEAFAAEGADTQFGLMGDGNMHWMTAMDHQPGMTTISARHEHCACLMAIGYWSATGKVGVVSVTHGPGFTQTMTALTAAARNRVPLIMFAGEAPLRAPWYLQAMDQAPLANACGAHYIALHSAERLYHQLREAFYIARTERKPVVLGVPLDLQKQTMPDIGPYRPSTTLMMPETPVPPDAAQIATLAGKLASAKCPVLVAGRGVIRAGAREAVEALAEASNALLGTSLLGMGMFDKNPFSLGIVGGYARQVARDVGRNADLVVVFGASLSRFTLNGGQMFPNAEIVQINTEPAGYNEGMKVADSFLRADARLAAEALLEKIRSGGPTAASVRSGALADRIRTEPADSTPYAISDGTLDPRDVIDTLDSIVPKDFHVVSGSAHQAYWHTTLRNFDPTQYHAIRDFGAIGNALSFAIGVAVARKDGKVVLFEGDGGLIMNIQELETMKRHGIKLLVVCINDGAFGAEIHKLRVEGVDDSGAVFGRPGFEAVSKAFGLEGATINGLDQFKDLMAAYRASPDGVLWDVHVSDRVLTPPMRDEVSAMKEVIKA